MYYLDNFRKALTWVVDRYVDLLAEHEHSFAAQFTELPEASQALLVRLLMRKGHHFRAATLCYPEIGDIVEAMAPLIGLGWINPAAAVTLEELFKIMTRGELAAIFPSVMSGMTKAAALRKLQAVDLPPRPFAAWTPASTEWLCSITVVPLCTRFRLLYFGNFSQEWSTFVVADLGILQYEKVETAASARAFQSRHDIEAFFSLFECRRRFETDEPLEDILAQIPRTVLAHEWLEDRRAKLLFHIATKYERRNDRDAALPLYLESTYAGSRLRAVRVLEVLERYDEAHRLADEIQTKARRGTESRRIARIHRRLHRRLGFLRDTPVKPTPPPRIDVLVERRPGCSVEDAALKHLSDPEAPVYYVENALVSSLFGLLFWDAIFAPIKGAFFNPYQMAPMDLFSLEFRQRREPAFTEGFKRLADGTYLMTMRRTFQDKFGLLSPFVQWQSLSEELLNLALACIPPHHLHQLFDHLLADLRFHRSGLPDLIQFYRNDTSYRMIEVKGPGDRLQENQKDWFDFCSAHSIPIVVCHVRWSETESIGLELSSSALRSNPANRCGQ